MNPKPIKAETSEKARSPPPARATPTYPRVVRNRIVTLNRNEARRPRVSANTPVGISKIAEPAANAALARKTSKIPSQASSRNSVFTPQIRAAASMYSPATT